MSKIVKRKLIYSLLAFIIIASSKLFAQEPIVVSITQLPPYPNYVDEIINMDGQTILSLQNTDFNGSHKLKLGIELTGGNGITVRTKENSLPNNPIEIGPGETIVLTGEDLSSFYNHYSESDFDFVGISMEDIINNQQLPDGVYTLCVRAYDFASGYPLSLSSPSGCTAPFTVVSVSPPIITYPINNEVISTQNLQFLNINWIPVSLALPDLRYRLEMVDLTEMPINPYDAFLSGDFLFFYEEDIISNTFLYGIEHPELQEGHEYAVRVRAYRQDGLLNVNNDGYSDIVRFSYGESSPTTGINPTDSVDTETTQPALPDQVLNCGAPCEFILTGSEASGAASPQLGDILQLGNFQMNVTDIENPQSNTGTYNGSGVIQATEYIPVGIKVNFTNIRVTESGRIFQGSAQAVIRENSWIDETWADLQTQTDALNINDYSDLYDEANDEALYIDHLESLYQSVGTSLPISIGEEGYSLQVVGMQFFPNRAAYNLSYLTRLDDDPSGEKYLHFMAKDMCITPGGPSIGADEARLELVKPIRFKLDQSTYLNFEPVSNGVAGTFLSFDCNGYIGVQASGNVRFNPEVFKPIDQNGNVQEGDTLIASFMTNFVSWSDWVASVSFDTDMQNNSVDNNQQFVYKELEDYLLTVNNAYIDHSSEMNPTTLIFPENFDGNTGVDWQGFYIETLKVDLPEWIKPYEESEERVQLAGHHLIVDSDGLTGKILASNVLSQEEGSMGKWPLTIDSVSVEIWQNNLVEAYFDGDLKIPVIDEPFDYTANIQFLPTGTVHTFGFSPIDSYTFSTWFASATLSESSHLEVNTGSNQAFIEATLHGNISFAPSIGDIDKTNLTDIGFHNMIVRSAKTPSYIEIGSIETGVNGQSLAIAGFGVILETLDWDENVIGETGLEIGVGLDLAKAKNSIRGGTTLFIKNEIESFTDSIAFTFEGTEIREINLAVETGAVNMDGTISFFKNDEKFGSGFEGSLTLGILETIKLSGTVLFGNKEIDNDKVNYWFAYAMAYLPKSPVPMATPLDIYGFGGGVYYNMAMDMEMPNPGAAAASTIDPREAFIVSPGILGIQASVVTALTPSSRTFNADVTLTAEINLNGGINLIALTGVGYVMQDLEAVNKDEAMISASVAIVYNFATKTFTADCAVEGHIPKEKTLLDISGDISFHRSPDLWYFKAGVPKDMLTTTIDMGVSGIGAGAYFMTGMNLPPPELPREIKSFFRFDSKMVNNIQNGMGIGFMAGLHLNMNIDLTALGTGIQIVGLAGADIAVLNFFASTCNKKENFGVNKWYAMGQGYVYGKFTLEAFTADVASLELGVILEGAFPNPTGVRGMVKAEAEVLIFETSIEQKFEIGKFCDIQPMANINKMVDREEIALESMDLVGVVTPANTEKGVSVGVQPTIQWHKTHLSEKRYVYADGAGGIIDQLYRFKNEADWKKLNLSNNKWEDINYSSSLDEAENIQTLLAENENGNPSLLHGRSLYKVNARSYIEKLNGSPELYYSTSSQGRMLTWETAKYLEGSKKGSPIQEIVAHQFTTSSNLTEIEELHVDYTLPYQRQRYYPYGYLSIGEIDFNEDNEPKFQDFEDCGFELHAEFEPVNGSEVQVVDVTREKLMQVNFSMATLEPSTIYKLVIVAEREVTADELANETYQHCKLNDSQTLTDLISDYGLNLEANNYSAEGINNIGPYGQQLIGVNATSNLIEDKILQRKILYTIHFRTSKYATPQEKLNSMSVSEVNLQSSYFYTSPTLTVIKDAHISINCGEGFDKYDLFGHDYRNSETMEYFRPYASGCNSEDLEGDVEDWYSNVCSALYKFGQSTNKGANNIGGKADETILAAQTAQDFIKGQPQLWQVSYKPDPSNYTQVKYVKPLLSDVECGLAEPATSGTFDPSALPLAGGGESQESSNSNSSNSNVSGGFGLMGMNSNVSGGFGLMGMNSNNSSYSVEGMQNQQAAGSGAPLIGGQNNPEIVLVYKPDRAAFNLRLFLLQEGYNISSYYEHTSPPSGNYPLKISLSNTNFDAEPEPAPVNHRVFNVNIPF
jgi:hypothetical protein